MSDTFDGTPLRHHPYRWRLSRAGFVNVWHYYETTFDISGGRLILRGTNGSGKSRALEMLLPFLLDADRRNMGTGSSVRMEDLMNAGAGEQGNRLGYMWLELRRDPDPAVDGGDEPQYLTLGALVRFAISTKEAKVWYFTTPLRVGDELPLLGRDRQPLSRRDLAELVTEERITDVAEKHRERVRTEVFGLTGQLGKERFDGLLKLLHTLRSPDVGNRIEEGRLPAILADALPPLSEDALTDAGQQLDGLTSTRADQERLEAAREQITTFLDVYRKYVTGVLSASLLSVKDRAAVVRRSTGDAARLAAAAEELERGAADEQERTTALDEQVQQLDATLAALRESDAYRNASDLLQLTTVVRTLASTADKAFGHAAQLRADEARRAREAGPVADDVASAVAALSDTVQRLQVLLPGIGIATHGLPAAVQVDRGPGPQPTDLVRTSREQDPERLARPATDTLTLVPADVGDIVEAARQVEPAAQARSAQAANRAADARRLRHERQRVDAAATKAGDAEQRAVEDEQAAEQAAEQRDDAAIALADAWHTWTTARATTDLLGTTDWAAHPILGALLADRTALCGDGQPAVTLPELDRAADDAVSEAEAEVAAALSRLDDADGVDAATVGRLTTERKHLLKAQDPEPQPPNWVRPSGGAALWRCLDFADGVDDQRRAGIEAALLASGLLVAEVDEDGRLTTVDGQLLVSPSGGPATRPLSAVLTADPDGPVAPNAVAALIERIAFNDPGARTWVGDDGRWGNGPLRGRHTVPAARHIGAAARAAARAARLAQIATELADLEAAREVRDRDREQLRHRRLALRDLRRSAPRSMALAQARAEYAAAVKQASRSAASAGTLRAEADRLARAWAEQDREHRRVCAEFGLPADEEPLLELRRRADKVVGGCAEVGTGAAAVRQVLRRYASAVEAVGSTAARRADAEQDAGNAWETWRSEATRLDVLRDAVGAEADTVQRQEAQTEAALKQARTQLRAATETVQRLTRETATAAAEAGHALGRVRELREALAEDTAAVLQRLSQPGVIETAFTTRPESMFADAAPEAVETSAATLLASLRRAKTDENALLRAQQAFEQAISGSYDVSATVSAGIRLFELIDADGRRPLAQAAVEVEQQCEAGRAALTAREQQVFTDFVLGEVGEELRRRLGQATHLIAAMNDSLRSIRTSQGIGVRLTWKLSDDASGDIARIKELITTAAAVRTVMQDRELTALLSARVAAEAVQDPTAGYAIHLRGALDYRAWHTVEVFITGPEPGRERRISRRAKLSQGETRFVSYVTLFAAIDAYLSGLENPATSLRLILLDDAFAKVDEPTIAELLGLLVRLDVDFAMTGHALWGCVPQVPALDIYEICREEGTPAATAHVRWDGRNRHFLHTA
ncbi:TIGR02680 family protein [Dactylosporangium sp. NPDC049525]|uniref:TIGR02680 family protein n=1 Tax=Dactylosporangium sp. NPDC049525 TaxID=3154730 RepID=UPI00343A709D